MQARFVVHSDFRSYIGARIKFQGDIGSPIQMSVEQNSNTDSSTTAELVAIHQILPKVLWVPFF